MDQLEPFRVVAALVLVLGLIGIAALVARRVGFAGASGLRAGKARRLGIVETIALDPKRRLVLVRCDDREHLLLLGPNADLVVAHDIAARSFHVPVDPPAAERKEPSL